MAWVEAPRAVSSTARPTRPPCDVLRPFRPAAAQAAANRRLIWSTLRPTTASPGSGETAACRLRTAAAQLPTRRRTSARPPVGSDFERADGDYDDVAVAEIDVGPAERGDRAATEGRRGTAGRRFVPSTWPQRLGTSTASVRRNPSSACRVSGPIGAGGAGITDVAPFITHRLPSPDIRTVTIGVRRGAAVAGGKMHDALITTTGRVDEVTHGRCRRNARFSPN